MKARIPVEDVRGVAVALVVIFGLAFCAVGAHVMIHDVPQKRNLYSPDETCTCTIDSNLRVRLVECKR